MTNIKIKRIKVNQSKGKSIGSNSSSYPNNNELHTILKHTSKIDAYNKYEPLIKRLSCLEYCIWDKNGFTAIKVLKGKLKSFAL